MVESMDLCAEKEKEIRKEKRVVCHGNERVP